MEVLCWIKPQVNPLFPISASIRKNICLQTIWLPNYVAKEFKIYFVTIITIARLQLHCIALPKKKEKPLFISNNTRKKQER